MTYITKKKTLGKVGIDYKEKDANYYVTKGWVNSQDTLFEQINDINKYKSDKYYVNEVDVREKENTGGGGDYNDILHGKITFSITVINMPQVNDYYEIIRYDQNGQEIKRKGEDITGDIYNNFWEVTFDCETGDYFTIFVNDSKKHIVTECNGSFSGNTPGVNSIIDGGSVNVYIGSGRNKGETYYWSYSIECNGDIQND